MSAFRTTWLNFYEISSAGPTIAVYLIQRWSLYNFMAIMSYVVNTNFIYRQRLRSKIDRLLMMCSCTLACKLWESWWITVVMVHLSICLRQAGFRRMTNMVYRTRCHNKIFWIWATQTYFYLTLITTRHDCNEAKDDTRHKQDWNQHKMNYLPIQLYKDWNWQVARVGATNASNAAPTC